MSDMINFFDGLFEEVLADIHTCLIGKIERFDPQSMTADVQPLFQTKKKNGNWEPLELLLDVPVAPMCAGGFFIRLPYKKGDLVVVVFAERSIDDAIESGESKEHTSLRKHSLDDGIVIGGLRSLANGLPAEHAEDLIFATEDLTTKFVMTKDKKIIIQAAEGVQIIGKNSTESW